MTYSCASCGAPAPAGAGCAHCGRPPDPDAVEVARTDAEITQLIGRLAAARRTVEDLDQRIGDAWERRNAAAARLRCRAETRTPPRLAGAAGRWRWWRPRPAASADHRQLAVHDRLF